MLPSLIKENPKYGDFANPLSYQESLNLVIHAQEQFNSLSSRVRERFANDPQKFLEFTSNPENAEEMVKLGLATVRKNDSNDQTDNAQDPKQPIQNEAKTGEK